ncbi:uncharacterized protein LOC128526406 [Clarias gariepinus]|uniref:uncharacterized protein LOC128526406 n=1 Tax=Clarias gariepinus TaxID=13013 RepID=UPI00234CE4C5|nr:uncharacterized protein LOC128526406 [Clarias gariepinus]
MSMQANVAKKRSAVRPCPQECGFSLHEKDQHEACPVCLGILHARRALAEPESCALCRQLRRSTLERRVTFVERTLGRNTVAQQDPLLSESAVPASPVSADEEFPSEVPAPSWADQMEYLEGSEDRGLSYSAGQQHAFEDDDVLDIGLEIHGLSEDEHEIVPPAQSSAATALTARDDTSFFALYRRAAKKLEVEWPSPQPAQKPSRFAGFFLPPEPTTVKNCLPMFPDFVGELTSSWSKPLSTRVSVPGYGQYLELDGAEKAGLVSPPPMEPSLAAYLAPSHNHGVSGPTLLPSKHCRFSSAQLEKIYRAQAGTARALNSATLLQTYQAMCLAELGSLVPQESPFCALLNEVRTATDYILRMSRCAALSLGRGMASAVVAQRHLWLTLSDIPDRDRAVYLDEPLSAEGNRYWYFVVPKRGGGLRPILDLRILNTFLRTYKFKMLTLRQLLNAIGPGDWFTTIDLTDAYFHIAIFPRHRKFLRFAFEGVAYEYLVLPFGLSLAPRTFTKCAEAALSPLREKGIRILAYLDDWALIASSSEQAEKQTALVLSHIQTLGFSVNMQKSSLIPSQQCSFLGLEICSVTSRARLSEHRIAAFQRCLALFQLQHKLRFRVFLQLMGMMASMITVVPLGLLNMRAFQRWVRSHRLCAARHLNRRLTVTPSCMSALLPWREPRLLRQGSPIGRVSFRKVVSTDASLSGWGALCDGSAIRGAWSQEQRRLHINYLELLAVFLALRHFRLALTGHHVLIRTDNTTVVSYINRQGGTRSLPLLKLSHSLLLWSTVHLLSLRATHIPGHLNLGADLLSRGGPLVREWRLHPWVVAQIWERFGRAAVDLFASKENAHCPLFFSITDRNAPLGIDALAHSWPPALLYAFPPVELILPVTERVRQQGLSLILVAPHWPAKLWYAEIVSLLAAEPWKLPLLRDLLSQAGGEVVHPRPELWNLHAYLLKGPIC